MSQVVERKFVLADPDKCIGCHICEYVCALEKEGFPVLSLSRIRVVHLNPFWVNTTMVCRFCKDAWCVKACSRDALKQTNEGLIVVDVEKCNLCSWCIQACPHGGIISHPSKKIVTCDLCNGKPKCVEFCPEEALDVVEEEVVPVKMWTLTLEKLLEKIERLREIIERRNWAESLAMIEKENKKLDEKLEMLSKIMGKMASI